MTRFQECLKVVCQTAGSVGVSLMAYGFFRFIARQTGQGDEGDARPILEAIHAIRALSIGGVLTLVACGCVYLDRFVTRKHGHAA
jgi:hypothetical protein